MSSVTFEQVKEVIVLVIAPLSALGGVWLASYLQKKDRDKNFIAKDIMLKKLNCYEKLFSLLNNVEEVASELFDAAKSAKTSKELENMKEDVFIAGLDLAKFTDKNRLYLDEDVTIHVVATALGPSSIFDLKPGAKKYKSQVNEIAVSFRNDFATGVELIEDYMGIKRLRKSFKKINRPETKSVFVDYADELRKKYKREEKAG